MIFVFLLIPGAVLEGQNRVLELLEMHHFEVEDFGHPSLEPVRYPPDAQIFVALGPVRVQPYAANHRGTTPVEED